MDISTPRNTLPVFELHPNYDGHGPSDGCAQPSQTQLFICQERPLEGLKCRTDRAEELTAFHCCPVASEEGGGLAGPPQEPHPLLSAVRASLAHPQFFLALSVWFLSCASICTARYSYGKCQSVHPYCIEMNEHIVNFFYTAWYGHV